MYLFSADHFILLLLGSFLSFFKSRFLCHCNVAKSLKSIHSVTKHKTFFQSSPVLCFLPFSGVVSCDEGSEAGGAETSLFSSFDDSPLGGLWKYSKKKKVVIGTCSRLNHYGFSKLNEKQTSIQKSWITHQNSFRHVLPKNKFCPTVCTVCGIFWTGKGRKRLKTLVSWWKLIIDEDEFLKILKGGHNFITLG